MPRLVILTLASIAALTTITALTAGAIITNKNTRTVRWLKVCECP